MTHHDPEVPELCPDCGHVHTGPEFGQICIGCPCLSVPAIVGERTRRIWAMLPPDVREAYANDPARLT